MDNISKNNLFEFKFITFHMFNNLDLPSSQTIISCVLCFQVQKLTTSLNKLQSSSKDTRDALTAEVNIIQDSPGLYRCKHFGPLKSLTQNTFICCMQQSFLQLVSLVLFLIIKKNGLTLP